MLRQVADGVLVHESEFCQSNAVVVRGGGGVLLIDAGVYGTELACLGADLSDAGDAVVAGFSTHPHWDHLLWHPALGAVPRYATARCAATVRERLSGGVEHVAKAAGVPDGVPLDLLGGVTGLPAGTTRVPWDGPQVRIIEHRAHAAGHAALVVEDRGVLVAGDMLSDLLIPMLDVAAADPIGDYLAALDLIQGLAVDVLVPGHGSIGDAGQVRARIDRDRAYLYALRDAREPDDPRTATGWVAEVHRRQLAAVRSATAGGRRTP
ncbi:MBL fold metallo-hydrolase [Actinoplanes ianthinogenes]|uniref:MBL fold metallo-hydrolase n=1 Tax=Actinoplanes ianthinogenes TaxID=122358 RepID=A0ABN6CQB0_9ACTN|nr:MBL fold metallo-hydrolase [Actinoplanes ianthinogenes]BCJ47418.1 MBL fold metallo-hydrolase [Actinoplanes ianthinogenes]GGR01670.1 MBL fold metallo-hydrolase [Actinoplanes ianthinogenes]